MAHFHTGQTWTKHTKENQGLKAASSVNCKLQLSEVTQKGLPLCSVQWSCNYHVLNRTHTFVVSRQISHIHAHTQTHTHRQHYQWQALMLYASAGEMEWKSISNFIWQRLSNQEAMLKIWLKVSDVQTGRPTNKLLDIFVLC